METLSLQFISKDIKLNFGFSNFIFQSVEYSRNKKDFLIKNNLLFYFASLHFASNSSLCFCVSALEIGNVFNVFPVLISQPCALVVPIHLYLYLESSLNIISYPSQFVVVDVCSQLSGFIFNQISLCTF